MKELLTKYWIIPVAIIVIIPVIALIIFFNRSVVVPDVTGKTLTEATTILNDAGFDIKTDSEYSDTVLTDTVISQGKKGGTKARIGSDITLVVSMGMEKITLPDLVNVSATEAENTLKELGLSVNLTEAYNGKIEKGKIVKQSIEAGEQVEKGETITLTVSKGSNLVTVPNIKGMTLQKAEQALEAAGLRLKAEIQCSSSVKEGKIISQDTAADEQVQKNSVIHAKISAGVSNNAGTTPSNINACTRIGGQGDWWYFTENYVLHRMRKDKTEKQVLVNSNAYCVNVVGEWVYYGNGSDGIYKVMLDGSNKTKISNVAGLNLYVEGEWIYYMDDDYPSGTVYKMKTDGSSVTRISGKKCTEFIVHEGYVYYVEASDSTVYRCRTDGTGEAVFCEGFGGKDLTVVDQKLVVINKNTYLLRVDLDGSGLSSYETKYVEICDISGYDGWVYYVEHDSQSGTSGTFNIGKMKPDGSQKTTLYEYRNSSMTYIKLYIADGWIYFENTYEPGKMYRMKTDGTSYQQWY